MNEKDCRDCLHFVHAPIFLCNRTAHEIPLIKVGELVTQTAIKREYCIDERVGGDCGEEGKYFEERQPTPLDAWD